MKVHMRIHKHVVRRHSVARVVLAVVASMALSQAQTVSRNRIDVQDYVIDAQVDPRTQTIKATAKMRFIPLDDTSSITLDLNNALSVDRVMDEGDRPVSASRTAQDMSMRLSLPQAAPKGKATTLTFFYDGKFTGEEESPVFGIKFASIKPDISYLMYPARWFPVNDYAADRFACDLRVTVPEGYKVVASGIDSTEQATGGMTAFRFKFNEASFPGSFAVVRGDAKVVSSGGVSTSFYLRSTADMAGAYGEEISRVMEYLTSLYGLPPRRNLTVVETENGTPNGYSAPGVMFLAPRSIGKEVNTRLITNQLARQWWGGLVSPATRNHLWIENGMARYSELLYQEHMNGPGALETQVRDSYVEGLTIEQPPLIQTARLEDYSPEYWAATAGKGAAVLHMLRGIVGDDNFFKALKVFPDKFAWKSVATDDFRKVFEDASGQNLNYFFLQWIESSGAPEFKMEYTVFRTSKGFRVVGKVAQDLDTFRMPVLLRIETEGNPEEKRIEVVGTSSEFSVDTFGKPKNVTLDPKGQVLRYDNSMRVAVQIRKGEQFVEVGEYAEALREYQKALEVARNSSLAHYRIGEVFFLQGNNQSAANEFRESLSGDLDPKWTEVWAHINLGKVFDITDQRERALNEYRQALRTKDNTQGALDEAQKYITDKYVRPRNSN
jgi:tetratricopeptide (TPR) repeat protein